MINYSEYTETHIAKFIIDTGIPRDNSFNSDELEKNLEKEVTVILEKFKREIKERSEEILMPLEITLKINNIIVGQEVNREINLIDFKLLEHDSVTFTQIDNIEKTNGLTWDEKNQKIIGEATESGDFFLIAHGILKSSKGYKQKIKSKFRLTVISDPRSLWKNIEPDETLPYPKKHEDVSYLTTEENFRLFFASKRGRSHAHIGTFRDDDGKIITTPFGWSVLCVADGAGSCSLSREGSRIATNTAVDILTEHLSTHGKEIEELFLQNLKEPSAELEKEIQKKLEGTIVTGAYHAFKNIHEKAKSIEISTKEFSTTLLLTAHKKVEEGHIIISFWIGDGIICIYTKNKKVELLGEPDSGEFAGQTRFLSNDIFSDKKNIEKRTSIKLVKDFTALVLATDGVSDAFFNTDEDLKDIREWDKFWENIFFVKDEKNIKESSKELLSWLDFWSIGNHDDRSIALLLPPEILLLEEKYHV